MGARAPFLGYLIGRGLAVVLIHAQCFQAIFQAMLLSSKWEILIKVNCIAALFIFYLSMLHIVVFFCIFLMLYFAVLYI